MISFVDRVINTVECFPYRGVQELSADRISVESFTLVTFCAAGISDISDGLVIRARSQNK